MSGIETTRHKWRRRWGPLQVSFDLMRHHYRDGDDRWVFLPRFVLDVTTKAPPEEES